ncbi:glycosyltransferase family 87 protein [Granulicella tundricola]|uniref:DUF2029 domain-containing protein n=1 Tax=Granulicella tundricola (strain ATCC BAA-1859 / DSM 23138 / MP5ACTX9) TaxID=1198114 RepID=E8WY08_GRATM|nr:glycosyltransferase family 87 protein [Granulicella tundricola]ADW67547.1 hypothetical protein AciX9_0475 [Granulicella tundricola MP5ACTX9]
MDVHGSPTVGPRHKAGLPPAFRLIVALLLFCQICACVAGAGPSLGGKVDFRPFYASGTLIRTGHAAQLYDYNVQQQVQNAVVSQRDAALPFLYPPFAALLFVPLSLLSYRNAFFLLLVLNLGCLYLAAQLLRPWLPSFRDQGRLTLPTVYGCLFAVSVALMQGQISFLLLLIFSGAWIMLQRQKPFVAGLLLSLALMKFQLALPVFLLFLVWRNWAVVSGFIAGGCGLSAISFATVGWGGLLSYKNSLTGIAAQTATNAVLAKQRFGMFPVDMPNLHGLSYGLSRGAHWGNILDAVLSVLILIFAARQRPSLLVALPAAMLVSYHMQPHDLVLLLLPLSFLADDLVQRRALMRQGQIALPARRPIDKTLLAASLLLILPLAAVFMAKGLNYLIAFTVAVVMVAAARRVAPAESGDVDLPVVD